MGLETRHVNSHEFFDSTTVAFEVPTGETWQILKFLVQAHLSTGVLNIIARKSAGGDPVWFDKPTPSTSINLNWEPSFSAFDTDWNGVILEAGDVIEISGGTGGLSEFYGSLSVVVTT